MVSAVRQYTARVVSDSLRQDKDILTQEVQHLAQGTLGRQLPAVYEFQEAGSFRSPLIRDVTDVDLAFFPQRGRCSPSMPLQDAELLRSAAARVLQTTLKYRIVITKAGRCDIEEEHQDWSSCLRMFQVRFSCHPDANKLSSAKLPDQAFV